MTYSVSSVDYIKCQTNETVLFQKYISKNDFTKTTDYFQSYIGIITG